MNIRTNIKAGGIKANHNEKMTDDKTQKRR
jgi:hypothetical protein